MKFKRLIIGISVIVVFVSVGFSVVSREMLLKKGKTVLFELAPADPRSIMQGDYMTLNYRITRVEKGTRYLLVGILSLRLIVSMWPGAFVSKRIKNL